MQLTLGSPRRNFLSRIELWLLSSKCPWILIALGAVLRLVCYLHNQNLSVDEAGLVLNIVYRTPRELLEPLIYRQQAPVGFLLVEKLASEWWGTSEYVFRLLPLLSGLLSLFVFHWVVRRILQPLEASVALFLFAISDYLVFYSSNVKPYSGDVLFALLVTLFGIRFLEAPFSRRAVFGFATIGFLGPWFSYASVLTLAGVGSVVLCAFWWRRDWKSVMTTTSITVVWITAFLFNYFWFWYHRAQSSEYLASLSSFFPRFPPRSPGDLFDYSERFFAFLDNPGGFKFAGLAALLFVLGGVRLWRRQPILCSLLIAPLFVAFAAAVLRKYPFNHRLILFLVPSALILIATALVWIWVKTRSVMPALGPLTAAFLLLYPVGWTLFHLTRPRTNQQIRPMLDVLKQSFQSEDSLLVYQTALPAFSYYQSVRRELAISNYVVGKRLPPNPRSASSSQYEDLFRLRGRPRVWVLITYVRDDEQWRIVAVLDSIGTRLRAVEDYRAALYLYDLSNLPAEVPQLESNTSKTPPPL